MVSKEECIDSLHEAAETLGRSPTKAEYEALGKTPASATIIRTLGGWNRAKRQAGLETNPSRGPRVQPKPDDVVLPEDMVWEDLSVDQRWHYRNRARKTERTLARRARLRAWLIDRKQRSDGCTRCGETGPECLDYHHREQEEKTKAVNKLILHGYGRDQLRKEISRCDILCANCHRKEHHDPSGRLDFTTIQKERLEEIFLDKSRWRALVGVWIIDCTYEYRAELGAFLFAYKQTSNGCSRCSEAHPACLDFHHVDPDDKTHSVSGLTAYEPSREELLEEVGKCELLCANCHRKEHYQEPSVGL